MGSQSPKDANRLKVKIGSKTWFIQFVRSRDIPADRYGDCGYAGGTPIIRVRRALRNRAALEILLHEVLHASRPELSEEAVTTTAIDLARVLWKRGYRHEKKV